jgi:hypothetical protein
VGVRVEHDGVSIEYAIAGDGAPVVRLHGFPPDPPSGQAAFRLALLGGPGAARLHSGWP